MGRSWGCRETRGVPIVCLSFSLWSETNDHRREASTHGSLSYSLVLSKAFPTLFSLLRPSFLLNAIKMHPFGSLYGRCARYFRTERMRRAFSFGSM